MLFGAIENGTSVSHVPRLFLVEEMSLGMRLHKRGNEANQDVFVAHSNYIITTGVLLNA